MVEQVRLKLKIEWDQIELGGKAFSLRGIACTKWEFDTEYDV